MNLRLSDEKNAAFLKRARWFGQKGLEIASIEQVDMMNAGADCSIGIYRVGFDGAPPELYLIPTDSSGTGFRDLDDPALLDLFFGKFSSGGEIKTRSGKIVFKKEGNWEFDHSKVSYEAFPGVSSNSLVVRNCGGMPGHIAKFTRRIQKGVNVEAEVNRHLFSVGPVDAVPPFRAFAEYVSDSGERYHIASLFDFVENEGSAWEWTLRLPGRYVDIGQYAGFIKGLGVTLADLHIALAKDGGGRFGVRPMGKGDIEAWHDGWIAQAKRSFDLMKAKKEKSEELTAVLANEAAIMRCFDDAGKYFLRLRSRIRQHGDFHLGQVLVSGKRFFVIDFEGEPLKAYGERGIHYPALKDVAGMMRSFNYAAFSAYFEAEKKCAGTNAKKIFREKLAAWEKEAGASFLNGYYSRLKEQNAEFLPLDDREALEKALKVLMMDKALYELEYEINNRPDWLVIPLGGILSALREDT